MADLTIANVGEKLVVGQVDTSFLTLSSKFLPGTAVLNGPVYMGALTGSIGLDRATCTIGPPLPGLSFPASLEVDGLTNIFGILNVTGVKNVFAFSNVFGATSRVGAKFATAFNFDSGLKIQAAVNISQGAKLCQAFAKGPLFNATAFVGNVVGTTGVNKDTAVAIKAAKGFDIPHPSKPNHRLRYICLEGPEVGAYIRGTLKNDNTIELPDYWRDLVYPESISVNLTPIGHYQELYVEEHIEWGTKIKIKNNSGNSIHCHYTVFAERKTKDKLQPEYEGLVPSDYPGNNDEYVLAGWDYAVKK